MADNYRGPGDVLDPIVTPSGGWVSGKGVRVGPAIFGVAENTTAAGELNVVRVEGEFLLDKVTTGGAGAAAIAVGDLVYANSAGVITKTASGNLLVGVAWSAAAETDATVLVKLK